MVAPAGWRHPPCRTEKRVRREARDEWSSSELAAQLAVRVPHAEILRSFWSGNWKCRSTLHAYACGKLVTRERDRRLLGPEKQAIGDLVTEGSFTRKLTRRTTQAD